MVALMARHHLNNLPNIKRFLEVQGMLKPPSNLFKPGVVARVIWDVVSDLR